MIALFIVGVFFFAIGVPLKKMLDKQGSRWSNLALILCIFIGVVCIGVFAYL